ncbi:MULTISPECIES: phage tail tape measure protein [Pantoea]|uniref:Phage tail tape measure protein n=1 Tax=Candidatus Pantoea gossypiicola TaxID=2608008 RepID=A0AB34CP97_9GAMM|nr:MULTISPECIES: phage tail tape measure protein [Pantoea]KAA5961002.1 phage tail tape measure protein [Pantoea sp. VH_24]KAA5964459.1 phage tail tape measure protein [Pantoea sp. VH_16]KAA5968604.1 phage tail tape measure protein [Pantoea sp. VH_18]KAA6004328.1 phage tail tape measure protein [Pantoea sp. M_1]KAA6006814.1 phage tail tape measure protein [Pantoea sp. F_7]
MSDVASLSVALHLNSATFKSQIADAYQKAGQASKNFNSQAKAQANELSAAIAKTVEAAKKIGGQSIGADQFSGVTQGAGQLNFVLHEVAAGSNVASSTIINALIPAVHSLKGQLDGSADGWQAQQEAARKAAQELASAAQQQISVAQAEKQAAISKAAIAEETIVAAAAQREEAIALDDYYAKRTEVNKQYGISLSYQEEHLKNERAIIEAERLEESGVEKLEAAKAAIIAAELAETEGKAALTAATEAAAAANTQLTVSQRIAATSSRALSSAMSLLGGPVGIGLSVLAAGGTLIYNEFKKAEEQTKKLNAAALDLSTSSLISATDLKRLNGELGDTENSVTAVSAAAKAGFSGQMLTQVATLATAYAEAGGNADDLVKSLSALRGDPVTAMEKLTASGVALGDSIIHQVMALSQRGQTAQASQLLIEAAIEAEKGRLKELGVEVDKTSTQVNNLGQTWGMAGNQAAEALGTAIDNTRYLQKLQKDYDESSARYIAASKAGYAAAQNERLKNAADLKSYMTEGTSAVEKRAAALKKLNNSIYSPDSADYKRILKGINDEYDKSTKKPKHKAATGETEGQRMLEQAQQRSAVLKEQALTNDKMTSSQSQLVAFDQKIAGLKGTALNASQQSLVNMQGQIRAQLQANVLLEREAALRKVSEKYQGEAKKWAEEAAAMKREAAASLDKYSQSDQESAQAEAKLAIENRFSQRRIALDKDFTDKTSAEYQARLADLESAKQQELQITEKSVSDRLALENDYGKGFRRGTLNWIDSARYANSQMASYAGSLFDSMTDSVATFATTGKLNFKSFTTSVLSDLAKIAARVALSNALQSILGTAFSSAANADISAPSGSGGSTGGMGMPTGWQAYASATKNAKGGVYNSPNLSSHSNSIVSQPTFFAFAKGAGVMGEAGPEAILPLTRTSGGALGVRSTGSASATTSPIVNVTITNNGNGQSSADSSSSAGWEQFARQITPMIQREAQKVVNRNLGQAGAITTAIRGQR